MKKFEVENENIIKLGEYLREIREGKGYAMNHVEVYTGIQRSEIKKIEEGQKKKVNPLYLKELAEFYNIDLIELYKMAGYYDDKKNKIVSERVTTYKLQVYKLDTSGNGVLHEKNEEVFILPENFEFIVGSFALEIENEKLEPNILDGDKVLVEKKDFENWKELDNKIVIVEYKGDKIARKVKFQDGEAMLVSFTGYEKNLKINDEIEYLGIITTLINRKL